MLIITGAAGLLAKAILHAFPQATGSYHSGKPIVSNKLIRADITTIEGLIKIMELKPSAIINCAAMTSVDDCEKQKEMARKVNSDAVSALSRECLKSGIKFVHISTDFVFDGSRGMYREDDKALPVNHYGLTKLMGEKFLGENDLLVRTSFFGWKNSRKENFGGWIVNSLRNGKEIKAFTNSYFTPIYVGYLARILVIMIEKNLSGTYHVAGKERISKYDFAIRAADFFGLDRSLIKEGDIKKWETEARRPVDTSLDCSRIQKTGISLPSLEESLRLMKEEEHLYKS
ncbi:MAG: SDR family oxidoreductase [Candidatus Aenigmarchaeota archaeon]|nr:SDR family oxidoreductase [Candidatus Aenigmarchaeota archaeon]